MTQYECQRCHRVFQRVGIENVCPVCALMRDLEDKGIPHRIPGQFQRGDEAHRSIAQADCCHLKEERLEIVGDNKGFIRCNYAENL